MFDQIFLSPKVKRSMIVSKKHGVYVMLHKLTNDLRLRILKNYKNLTMIVGFD